MSRAIIDSVWHFLIEDDLGFSFCAGLLKQNQDISISATELKKVFKDYFKKTVGISPYTKCPECGEKLLPRRSKYGYFVGCSSYPKCRFMATDSNPYSEAEGGK